MHVLDIDLDAFLYATATWGAPSGSRLKETEYPVWSEANVRSFLEQQCGLSAQKPTPGALFEHHNEVFLYWKQLIESNRLDIPFDVVHVDAHSDLSSEGTGAHIYILEELLAYPIDRRADEVDWNKITFANFPAFAAALGWLKSFTWVRPPTGDDGILQYYVSNGAIHLKHYPRGTFKNGTLWDWKKVQPIASDLPITARKLSTSEYKAERVFDYVTLCRSPQFTPRSADALFESIRAYINEPEGTT